ncbi:MAG: alkane 1-monooxygenase [Litoreibacter sp.]|uniref:alkane 1-monooxygenase n=1 Tax=Litoreibacter sp. TaxID=1969459 RepID=UPI003299096B
MPRSFLAFTLATLFPLPFLLAGAIFGGWAVWIALFYMTAVVAGIDVVVPALSRDGEAAEDEEADMLSLMLVGVHFFLLFLMIWALSGHGTALLSINGIALFIAAGLYFGQVSSANAHELIHRGSYGMRRAGSAVYTSLLFGHYASCCLRIHDPFVGTERDPASAKMGQTIYQYLGRNWLTGFAIGLKAENQHLTKLGADRWDRRNPFLQYVGGAVALLLLSLLIAGWSGVVVCVLLSLFAQLQILLCNYVQHYGLERSTDEHGNYAPVNVTHSWNAPHWMSSLLMLNMPRHSDHHVHPEKRFTLLDIPARGEAPMLPYSLPVMSCIALHAAQWRKVMDPHVEAWRSA